MPGNEFSRYYRTEVYEDESEPRTKTLVSYRTPFSYRERGDNRVYEVAEGDTLASIARKVYPSIGAYLGSYSSARLYWAIADYQPTPIIDPTIQLRPGSRLVLPSVELLTTEIIGG